MQQKLPLLALVKTQFFMRKTSIKMLIFYHKLTLDDMKSARVDLQLVKARIRIF